jgi:hypothetical protein
MDAKPYMSQVFSTFRAGKIVKMLIWIQQRAHPRAIA